MEWRVDETALRQTETEGQESQVPIVNRKPKSPTPQKSRSASGIRSCSVQELSDTLSARGIGLQH